MSLAFIAELATVVGFVVTLGGGKVKRQGGWKVLGGLLGAVAVVEVGAMAVVVSYLLFPYLPYLCCLGWGLMLDD